MQNTYVELFIQPDIDSKVTVTKFFLIADVNITKNNVYLTYIHIYLGHNV